MGYFSNYFGGYFDVATGSVAEGVAEAQGLATAEATWAWTSESVGESAGLATPESIGTGITDLVGLSEGSSTAESTADPLGPVEAVAEAHGEALAEWAGESTAESIGASEGLSDASGVAEIQASAETQPTGGWLAYNDAQRARRLRKRREEEELADRLEAQLAKEGLVPPNPVIVDRITVREYVRSFPPPSRRADRAVAYAEKAQTALAWQLAAKAIREAEEDDFALLLALSSIA